MCTRAFLCVALSPLTFSMPFPQGMVNRPVQYILGITEGGGDGLVALVVVVDVVVGGLGQLCKMSCLFQIYDSSEEDSLTLLNCIGYRRSYGKKGCPK